MSQASVGAPQGRPLDAKSFTVLIAFLYLGTVITLDKPLLYELDRSRTFSMFRAVKYFIRRPFGEVVSDWSKYSLTITVKESVM